MGVVVVATKALVVEVTKAKAKVVVANTQAAQATLDVPSVADWTTLEGTVSICSVLFCL